MIAQLTGTVHRQSLGGIVMDVQGVGYAVSVPIDVWEKLEEASLQTLSISTYVREDRLELFGFLDTAGRTLFELLISQSGIGPKTGLDLCAVPKNLLLQAVEQNDPKLLTNVKGVGKKTAEKLIVELRTVVEKQPDIFGEGVSSTTLGAHYDEDAISALTALGYDTSTIMSVLKELPEDLGSTEERVTAALRSL